MDKVFRVARTEYLNAIRTKAFLISVVLMPVFMFGAIVVQTVLADKVDLSDRKVLVVDGTGQIGPRLEAAVARRNLAAFEGEGDDRRQVRPRFLIESVAGEAATPDHAALSERVRRGDAFAYLIVPPAVLDAGDRPAEVAYHTATPTYTDLPEWLSGQIQPAIHEMRLTAAGFDPAAIAKLEGTVFVGRYGLLDRPVAGATAASSPKRIDSLATFGVPAAAMFLLFSLVMMSTPALMNSVLEEKMQRISEVLISSVSPFELFLGKLLGAVFVSWTLAAIYLGGIAWATHHFGVAGSVNPAIYAWFLLFQLLALLIFGSIFSALGAACSELRDAQSLMMPAMLLVMLPLFIWMSVIRQPDSTFAVVLSLVPTLTPFIMLLRVAIPPGPPAWQIALALLITAAFCLACVWAAGRIFRVGVLAQGQAPSFRRMVAWIFSS